MSRAALGCAVAFAALAVLVTTGATARADAALSAAAVDAARAHPGPTRLAQLVEAVTQPVWVYLLGLAGVVAVWRRGRRRHARAALLAGALAALASPALKAAFGRERPALDAGFTTAGGGSFPSGHALASATVVLVAVLLLVPPRWRRAALALGVLELAVVAVDRVWVGAHWPSDVLAGFLLAGVVVAAVARPVLRPGRSEGDGDRPSAPDAPGPGVRG
ncbi:undecaprenyl-diphosphatase [Kineococcus radiotolerans]|uniref:Undecaprenyl-diphosphatase n=1 Tax=Kineococcus radiotolerans TaxID=131568 RepID=A0A7W4XYA6_KINRA|nr:phosphatase PAP2 family protein [Kineococcus radiotolerans]MBB2902823.1 undecaprenyl-diphosphatase [Kineococcus radiotolerans]